MTLSYVDAAISANPKRKKFLYEIGNYIKHCFDEYDSVDNFDDGIRKVKALLELYIEDCLAKSKITKNAERKPLNMFDTTSMMGQTGMRPLLSPSPKIQNE